jgi:REP element-mobilizing transposase RayT
MQLNDYGEIAQKEWQRTTEIRKNVKLHEFIVMPNHIHGILEIVPAQPVGARRALPRINDLHSSRFQNQGRGTLSSIIGAYKSSVSKQIHETGFIGKIWQRNFYEQVIRDEQSYQNISEYIMNNPMNWQNDELFQLLLE